MLPTDVGVSLRRRAKRPRNASRSTSKSIAISEADHMRSGLTTSPCRCVSSRFWILNCYASLPLFETIYESRLFFTFFIFHKCTK